MFGCYVFASHLTYNSGVIWGGSYLGWKLPGVEVTWVPHRVKSYLGRSHVYMKVSRILSDLGAGGDYYQTSCLSATACSCQYISNSMACDYREQLYFATAQAPA